MNKLQLLSAIAIMGICTYSCNTKPEKAKDATVSSTENATPAPVKTLDIDQIMQCALNGEIELVKDALDKGFDPNSADPNKRTALMLAAYNGHNEIVKLLIDKGADVNATDTINRTALMFASTGAFAPTVTTLLQAGAKPNMIDNEQNWTAAMMAAAEGQLEVLIVLTEHGADLTMIDADGDTCLKFADSKGFTDMAAFIRTQLK